MDVTSRNSSANASAASTPSAAASSAKSGGSASGAGSATGGGLTADFNTFLKLLTTQLKYQDPLQPMESTEFVAQLASFSSVEQQVGSNTRLDSILSSLNSGAAAEFADWIGKSVRAPTSAAFSGTPVEVGLTPAEGADKAVMVVKNAFGTEVARVTVDPTATTATWDGTTASGTAAASGNYSFSLQSYQGDTLLSTTDGAVFATVTEVRRAADGGTELVLGTGDAVDADDVTAVRDAS